jgi:hypothetical protein
VICSRRCIPAAIGLFFIAFLVAEFLLGDLPLTFLPALVVLAPAPDHIRGTSNREIDGRQGVEPEMPCRKSWMLN